MRTAARTTLTIATALSSLVLVLAPCPGHAQEACEVVTWGVMDVNPQGSSPMRVVVTMTTTLDKVAATMAQREAWSEAQQEVCDGAAGETTGREMFRGVHQLMSMLQDMPSLNVVNAEVQLGGDAVLEIKTRLVRPDGMAWTLRDRITGDSVAALYWTPSEAYAAGIEEVVNGFRTHPESSLFPAKIDRGCRQAAVRAAGERRFFSCVHDGASVARALEEVWPALAPDVQARFEAFLGFANRWNAGDVETEGGEPHQTAFAEMEMLVPAGIPEAVAPVKGSQVTNVRVLEGMSRKDPLAVMGIGPPTAETIGRYALDVPWEPVDGTEPFTAVLDRLMGEDGSG